jgi:hypothetical protein
MSESEKSFVAAVLEAKTLPVEAAERRLRELLATAISEGRELDARSCRTLLSMYLAEQGKTRESLRVCVELLRGEASTFHMACVAYALERHGWFGFAESVFDRILKLPEESGDARFKLHEEAREGRDRVRLRKTQRRER